MSRFLSSKSTMTRTLIAAMVSLAGASAAMGQAEVEPNGTIATANPLPSANTKVTGTLSGGFEEDYFRITLTEHSTLSIRLSGPTPGVCPPHPYDPILTLFNSAGVQIALNDDADGNLCSRLDSENTPAMANLAPGVYYIRATQINNVNSPYSMMIASAPSPVPLTETFTYQGKLSAAGSPVTGSRSMRFTLWTDPTSTAQQGLVGYSIEVPDVEVSGGLFAVDLSFVHPGGTSSFDGNERYLQIEVSDTSGSETYIPLMPRQRLTPAPHAIQALRAKDALEAAHAHSATNANNSINATNAANASNAQFANRASTADSVDWYNIFDMPPDIADGDSSGGWTESVSTTYTFRSVGINTSNPGSWDLAVAGTASKTGGGSWATFCDERLKHDIKPMSGTLDRLLQLRGYTYEYNADAVENRLALPGTQIGLMAQEVERVFPDWVGKDSQGYRYVTERATTALMVEALRDLRAEKDAQIETLKKEAAAREAQNAELKARLDAIEAMLKTSR